MSADAGQPLHVFSLGAQKAGTTWMYGYFRNHPQIHVPKPKELHYFDSLWLPDHGAFAQGCRARLTELEERGASGPALDLARALVRMHDAPGEDHAAYRDILMRGYTSEVCVADITPSYGSLGLDHLQRMLADFAPAKMIFVLRDPVQRMWSQIRMHLARRDGAVTHAAADEMIARMMRGQGERIWKRSRLGLTLRYVRALPPEQVKVMYYETLFEDAQIRDLCGFLGVDFVPADFDRRYRASDALDMTTAQRATLRWLNEPEYRAIHQMEGASVPDVWDMDADVARWPEGLAAADDDEKISQGRTI